LDASLPLSVQSVSVGNSAEMLAIKEQSYNIEYNRKRKKSQKPVKKTLKNQYMDSHLMTILLSVLSNDLELLKLFFHRVRTILIPAFIALDGHAGFTTKTFVYKTSCNEYT
jgi:hypothetical protein